MKRNQWIIIGAVFLLTLGVYALTQNEVFGSKIKKPAPEAAMQQEQTPSLSIDTILVHAKEGLSQDQQTRLSFLENSISRGDVKDQKEHLCHQLAQFWHDTARKFEPYAWYTAEAARLENSEKTLTFAARLFLDGLRSQEEPSMKQWEAMQAKDLFERSLKLNPENDSSKVGLGATYLFGGFASPMEGIQKIRDVVAKDPSNVYAQFTLGEASLISQQIDKAIERYKKVLELQPKHLEAILRLGDIYAQKGDKAEAVRWYSKALPLMPVPEYRAEIEKRIEELKK